METEVTIKFVKGGFIMETYDGTRVRTEVFNSPPKLMKALKTAVAEYSLVAPVKKDKEDSEA